MAVAADSERGTFVSEEIRLILIGKTGAGKSFTGNTIIGKTTFKVECSASSVTKSCEHIMFERFGRDILLVDCPGFFPTGGSQKDIKEELRKCIALSSPGVHAILFVIGIGRFTEEESNSVKKFLSFFGSESQRHVIVIFTRKEDLEQSLKSFIDTNLQLRAFINKTGETDQNYLAVNNKSTDDNEVFVRCLLDLVDTLNGRFFINDMYQEAELQMKKIEKEELDKLLHNNQRSDAEYIANGVAEYKQTLADSSESKEESLSRKRQELRDKRRKLHEKEARKFARNHYDGSNRIWTLLTKAVEAALWAASGSWSYGMAFLDRALRVLRLK
ncbi:GTPase IMAP family member 7-like isoform X1 [Haliotis rufescens]|uniref:GTPase IMAP family member 7-like isoform X1 n=1 Tax=Haliotis rufescens TaxID=6454 RepID=UPI00201E8081|nr:GTPase IMAP family member 7-like isoform X1 [Haliotis rufescens]